MEPNIYKKILFWIYLNCILITCLFLGLLLSFLALIFLPLIVVIIFILLGRFKRAFDGIDRSKELLIISYFSLIMSFSITIGLYIPIMEEENAYLMAVVLMPLLMILNYAVLDRFHHYLKENKRELLKDEMEQIQSNIVDKKKPIIEFEGKKYMFSVRSLVLFATGSIALSFLIYIFFDTPINFWLHEIVVKQTVFFLNLVFGMGAEAVYSPIGHYHWYFRIPGRPSIYFETFCTGVQAITVFAGIILSTPHSQDTETNKDILWRKTKSLVMSSVIFYVVNIFRMLIQLYLYYIGYSWQDIHYSISAASSFIAAIIILLLHKWIPEFIISIIYIGTLISEPLKEKKRARIIETVKKSGSIELEMIRKAFGFNKGTFKERIAPSVEENGFLIEDNHMIIQKEQLEKFEKAMTNKFKTSSE